MRRRGVRVFALVFVIVALSIATLGFKEIHVWRLDAEGSGPLGLTLGLDLQGGSHLQYQADLPDEVRVRFQDKVEEPDLQAVLTGLGHTNPTLAKREFVLNGLDLEEPGNRAVIDGLEEEIGPIEAFATGDGALEVTFQAATEESALLGALDQLGHTDAAVLSSGDRTFIIQGVSQGEAALEQLRNNLEDRLARVQSLETGDGALDVVFEDSIQEADLRKFLNEAGYVEATISVPSQERYTIGQLSLDDVTKEELREALEREVGPLETFSPRIEDPTPAQMDGVVDTIQRRVNALGTTEPIIQTLGSDRVIIQLPGVGGSTINVTFRSIPSGSVLAAVLGGLGRTSDTVLPSGLNSYVIRSEETVAQEDRNALVDGLEGFLGSGIELEATGDAEKEFTLTFPSPPSEPTVRGIVLDLGFMDFTVQSSGTTFTIRTDDALRTEEQDRLRGALEAAEVSEIVEFEVTGGIEEAKNLIGDTAQLVFRERECLVSLEELQAARLAGLPDPCQPVEQGGGGRFVDKDIGLTGEDLSRAYRGSDPTTNAALVHIEFNGRGADIFRDLTTRLAGNDLGRIAIFLDNEQISAPVVNSPILAGAGVIEGGFTRASARALAIQLESGRLPVPLTLIQESTVDALLGADSLRKSLIAGFVGLGLVLLFMLVYYRMAGVVAGTSLVIYAVILLAIFKLVPVTLTLGGIAGLVLSIGFAVDANILIFERMKEEMRTGRTLASAMDVGFRRAWNAIRDSNVSTIITCLILWWFGSRLGAPVVSGFAITLLIGVLVSMFTAIMVSRNMLQILALTPVGKRVDLFTPEPRRQPVGIAGGGK